MYLEWIKEVLINKYFGAITGLIATASMFSYWTYKLYKDYKFNKEQDNLIDEIMEKERKAYKKDERN